MPGSIAASRCGSPVRPLRSSTPTTKSRAPSPLRAVVDWVAAVKPLESDAAWPAAAAAEAGMDASPGESAASSVYACSMTSSPPQRVLAAASVADLSTGVREPDVADDEAELLQSRLADTRSVLFAPAGSPRRSRSCDSRCSIESISEHPASSVDTEPVAPLPRAAGVRCERCITQARIAIRENLETAGELRLGAFVARRHPPTMGETEFVMPDMDKVFSSAWLSDTDIVLGTKCNKLLVLNTLTGKSVEIPSPVVSHTAESQPQAAPLPLYSPAIGFGVGFGAAAALPNSGAQAAPQMPLRAHPVVHRTTIMGPQHCAGIHSVTINPSKTLIAVGGGRPTDIVHIYRLPTFEPYALLQGHKDVVFSVAWLNDTTLVSGSRDSHLMQWSLRRGAEATVMSTYPLESPIPIFEPISAKKEHRGKVRDLGFDPFTRQAFTLSSDGSVKIWDAAARSCDVVATVPLYHTSETVCLSLDYRHHLVAVGSQSHISIIDPRVGGIVHIFESRDEGWGVRSLCANGDIFAVGGGLGRISFYDMRAQQYLSWRRQPLGVRETEGAYIPTRTPGMFQHMATEFPLLAPAPRQAALQPSSSNAVHAAPGVLPEISRAAAAACGLSGATLGIEPANGPGDRTFLQSGHGWLDKDRIYMNHFQGADIRNAVYTLSFDSTGRRMFAAGGPLQLNLRGSYLGLWQ
ncbi:hypothetical protein HK105_200547 [Polyrhizophydium stewartii]|uniref:DDB1- and CUL4-associated factor 12 beta-propeller domain-containing protein n=1 Tax=Polyrhizophydium stewartii TaxID=2732419 RepID=A0ABR4NJH4_9FUNG